MILLPHPFQNRIPSAFEIRCEAVVELGGELLAAYDAAVGIRPVAVIVATLTGEVVSVDTPYDDGYKNKYELCEHTIMNRL